jgi:hypothetical protein
MMSSSLTSNSNLPGIDERGDILIVSTPLQAAIRTTAGCDDNDDIIVQRQSSAAVNNMDADDERKASIRECMTSDEQACSNAWHNRPQSERQQVIVYCYNGEGLSVQDRVAQTLHLRQEVVTVSPLTAPFDRDAYLTNRKSIENELSLIFNSMIRITAYLDSVTVSKMMTMMQHLDDDRCQWYLLKHDIEWLPVKKQPLQQDCSAPIYTIFVQYYHCVSSPPPPPPPSSSASQTLLAQDSTFASLTNGSLATDGTSRSSMGSGRKLKTVAQVIARYKQYTKDMAEYTVQLGRQPTRQESNAFSGVTHGTRLKDKRIYEKAYYLQGDDSAEWDSMLVEQFRKQYMDNEEQEETGDEEGKERA